MAFTKKWGGKANGQAPSFIQASDLDKGMKRWQHVFITSVKEAESKNGKIFLWITYRQVAGLFLHRQSYFFSNQLDKLLGLFDIQGSIESEEPLKGKKLWIHLTKDTPDHGDREYVRVDDYSLSDESVGEEQPPFG